MFFFILVKLYERDYVPVSIGNDYLILTLIIIPKKNQYNLFIEENKDILKKECQKFSKILINLNTAMC